MIDFFVQGIGNFYYHKQELAAGGYNYYGYIHRTGRVLMLREEISSDNILYANGGITFDTAWTNRVTLTYTNINFI